MTASRPPNRQPHHARTVVRPSNRDRSARSPPTGPGSPIPRFSPVRLALPHRPASLSPLSPHTPERGEREPTCVRGVSVAYASATLTLPVRPTVSHNHCSRSLACQENRVEFFLSPLEVSFPVLYPTRRVTELGQTASIRLGGSLISSAQPLLTFPGRSNKTCGLLLFLSGLKSRKLRPHLKSLLRGLAASRIDPTGRADQSGLNRKGSILEAPGPLRNDFRKLGTSHLRSSGPEA